MPVAIIMKMNGWVKIYGTLLRKHSRKPITVYDIAEWPLTPRLVSLCIFRLSTGTWAISKAEIKHRFQLGFRPVKPVIYRSVAVYTLYMYALISHATVRGVSPQFLTDSWTLGTAWLDSTESTWKWESCGIRFSLPVCPSASETTLLFTSLVLICLITCCVLSKFIMGKIKYLW